MYELGRSPPSENNSRRKRQNRLETQHAEDYSMLQLNHDIDQNEKSKSPKKKKEAMNTPSNAAIIKVRRNSQRQAKNKKISTTPDMIRLEKEMEKQRKDLEYKYRLDQNCDLGESGISLSQTSGT